MLKCSISVLLVLIAVSGQQEQQEQQVPPNDTLQRNERNLKQDELASGSKYVAEHVDVKPCPNLLLENDDLNLQHIPKYELPLEHGYHQHNSDNDARLKHDHLNHQHPSMRDPHLEQDHQNYEKLPQINQYIPVTQSENDILNRQHIPEKHNSAKRDHLTHQKNPTSYASSEHDHLGHQNVPTTDAHSKHDHLNHQHFSASDPPLEHDHLNYKKLPLINQHISVTDPKLENDNLNRQHIPEKDNSALNKKHDHLKHQMNAVSNSSPVHDHLGHQQVPTSDANSKHDHLNHQHFSKSDPHLEHDHLIYEKFPPINQNIPMADPQLKNDNLNRQHTLEKENNGKHDHFKQQYNPVSDPRLEHDHQHVLTDDAHSKHDKLNNLSTSDSYLEHNHFNYDKFPPIKQYNPESDSQSKLQLLNRQHIPEKDNSSEHDHLNQKFISNSNSHPKHDSNPNSPNKYVAPDLLKESIFVTLIPSITEEDGSSSDGLRSDKYSGTKQNPTHKEVSQIGANPTTEISSILGRDEPYLDEFSKQSNKEVPEINYLTSFEKTYSPLASYEHQHPHVDEKYTKSELPEYIIKHNHDAPSYSKISGIEKSESDSKAFIPGHRRAQEIFDIQSKETPIKSHDISHNIKVSQKPKHVTSVEPFPCHINEQSDISEDFLSNSRRSMSPDLDAKSSTTSNIAKNRNIYLKSQKLPKKQVSEQSVPIDDPTERYGFTSGLHTYSVNKKLPLQEQEPTYHLRDPTKGKGIAQLSDQRVLMMESSKVCYACSSLNDASCWFPNRATMVKYCRPGRDVCVTKTYKDSSAPTGLIVIRDCSSACNVKTPGLDIHYDSCSICKEDLCNRLPVHNGGFSFRQFNIMLIFAIIGVIKFMS